MTYDAETDAASVSDTQPSKNSWGFSAAVTILSVIAVFTVYWPTVWSMITVWLESDTFTHGFIILPISVFLIWRKRQELAMVQPKPVSYGPLVLVIPGFIWLLGFLSDVQSVQQICFVAAIILVVWVLLGREVVKLLAFPLGYLFFAVPIGKFMVPMMIDFAAVFAVNALRMSGVPVFAEGTSFSTPGADWVVLEVCSGMRYLLAALVVGTLYAYLNYHSQLRRLLFVLVTVIFTFFASGMRVYIIVMIGHFVDMRYAKGFDHLFIGWVFFGIVMLILFWFGSLWRDDIPLGQTADTETPHANTGHPVAKSKWMVIALISILVLAAWPVLGNWMNSRLESNANVTLPVPVPVASAGWQLSSILADDWQPDYTGQDAEISQTYRKGDRKVGVYLPYYGTQRQDAELVSANNRIIKSRHARWKKVGQRNTSISVSGLDINIVETRMYSAQGYLLVYHWNWLDGINTTSPYLAKFLEARSQLFGKSLPAAAVIIYTDYIENREPAEQALQSFLEDMLPAIEETLESAAGNDT